MDAERSTTITDVGVMRALAHPARLALLDHLLHAGPATATECAGVVNLTPSATSYHLRALAKVGIVEEAPGRGDGRERLWRTTSGDYRFDSRVDPDPATGQAKRELLDTFFVWEDAQIRQYLARADDEPKEWRDAAIFGGWTLMMTAEELAEVGEAIKRLLRPYWMRTRKDPPDAARRVFAVVRACPTDPPLRP
ncbi:MAG TPA: winged helix-turn-helix domain-containing protein [Actinophytocola sp.]|uniref:ArsR/SmtB family transcription factor n=1 Tax=Actinophytocola sp. TaxID=1872138 RepID=UPI002DDDA2D2|nr:winged helix-turn-helix domain-containing protein [Actinophytocola sp.]HEV2781804.1 winged helix-turn-helix domain-containing protein [Actinophytocola sp.]